MKKYDSWVRTVTSKFGCNYRCHSQTLGFLCNMLWTVIQWANRKHERSCTSTSTSNPYIHVILSVAYHLWNRTQYWCHSVTDSIWQLKFSLPQQWQDACFTLHCITWQSKSHSTPNSGPRKFCTSVRQTMPIMYYQHWIFQLYLVEMCWVNNFLMYFIMVFKLQCSTIKYKIF